MTYTPTQLANARLALAVVRLRGLDDGTAQQVLAGMLTECTLWNYANPIFPETLNVPGNDGYPPVELAPSTKKSCGVFQQQPQWWGHGATEVARALSLMDVQTATGLFLDALALVPRNVAEPWLDIQSVQQSEFADASNYRAAWVAAGDLHRTLVRGSPAAAVTILGWVSTMSDPDQGKLDAFADEVAAKVVWYKINDTNVADLAYNNRHYTANAVQVILQDDFDGNTADLETLSVSLALTGFPLQLVAVSDSKTGAIYATDGASVFRHVKDVGVLAAGVAAKLWTGTAAPVTCVQRDLLYAFVAQPNGVFPDPS